MIVSQMFFHPAAIKFNSKSPTEAERPLLVEPWICNDGRTSVAIISKCVYMRVCACVTMVDRC